MIYGTETYTHNSHHLMSSYYRHITQFPWRFHHRKLVHIYGLNCANLHNHTLSTLLQHTKCKVLHIFGMYISHTHQLDPSFHHHSLQRERQLWSLHKLFHKCLTYLLPSQWCSHNTHLQCICCIFPRIKISIQNIHHTSLHFHHHRIPQKRLSYPHI